MSNKERVQEGQINPLLSVAVKKIQVDTKIEQSREMFVVTFMRQSIEIKIAGYVISSTHPISSKKAEIDPQMHRI